METIFNESERATKYSLLAGLLSSRERTTDILEEYIGHRLKVVVIEQKLLDIELPVDIKGKAWSRETILCSDYDGMTVSHNHVLFCPELLPAPLDKKMILQAEGIGEVIRGYNLSSRREIKNYGLRDKNTIVNLFGEPLPLHFSTESEKIPFKEYTIRFHDFDIYGMKIIEYFNPDIIHILSGHRLLG